MGKVNYMYDVAGRLLKVAGMNGILEEAYAYDLWRIVCFRMMRYVYDGNGNMMGDYAYFCD